jgi:hypothetical protein
MMRLNLAPKPTEGIEEKFLKLWKTMQHNIGDELTQKHDYIDANQEFIADPQMSPSSLPHLIIGMKTRVLGTLLPYELWKWNWKVARSHIPLGSYI